MGRTDDVAAARPDLRRLLAIPPEGENVLPRDIRHLERVDDVEIEEVKPILVLLQAAVVCATRKPFRQSSTLGRG